MSQQCETISFHQWPGVFGPWEEKIHGDNIAMLNIVRLRECTKHKALLERSMWASIGSASSGSLSVLGAGR